ncbi:MAG: hypothetical protein IID37_09015 [Planctomycetes bacterium]|nr:hypothetical protein [Planctomycetota bacterium]
MAHSYTPGLKVTEYTTMRYRRILPIKGKVLVKEGDTVKADQVVAEAMLPGDIEPVNLANLLSMPPADVAECVVKKEGERIEVGELLARTKGIFGFFGTEVKAKVAGTVETVSHITGQLMIRGAALPVQVKAYVSGQVIEIIADEGCIVEAQASFIQGIFGIGGETVGPIRMACSRPDEPLDEEHISDDLSGAVVVGGGRVTAGAIAKAVKAGVAALVSGGIDDQDLRDFLGYDLGVAITGSEQLGITLVMTEGFGDIAMAGRTFELLKRREGCEASVNGATQIRAGVMRPEVTIPITGKLERSGEAAVDATTGLGVGLPVRLIRHPYFGKLGTVSGMPSEPHVLDSGSKARVLEVEFKDGTKAIVPRANVEIIEG